MFSVASHVYLNLIQVRSICKCEEEITEGRFRVETNMQTMSDVLLIFLFGVKLKLLKHQEASSVHY